jgi:hypothetical protein
MTLLSYSLYDSYFILQHPKSFFSIERIGGKRTCAITRIRDASFKGTSSGGGAVSGLKLTTFHILNLGLTERITDLERKVEVES